MHLYAHEQEPVPTKFAHSPGGALLACFRPNSPADQAFRRGWEQYHAQHARLEPLCKLCQSGGKATERRQQHAQRRQRRGGADR